jgi:hypothetical protein
MKIVTIWPLFLAIFVVAGSAFVIKSSGLLDQYRDWCHGRAIDETLEWQAFNDAFESDK